VLREPRGFMRVVQLVRCKGISFAYVQYVWNIILVIVVYCICLLRSITSTHMNLHCNLCKFFLELEFMPYYSSGVGSLDFLLIKAEYDISPLIVCSFLPPEHIHRTP